MRPRFNFCFVMERHGFAALLLLLFLALAADVSESSVLLKLRKLVATNESSEIQVSPSPSPVPLQIDNRTDNGTSSEGGGKVPDKSSEVDSKGLNNSAMADQPPLQNPTFKKNTYVRKREPLPPEVSRNCTGVTRRCRDQKSLLACIFSSDTGSQEFLVVVENEGEELLSVDLVAPNHKDDALIEIHKHERKQIKLAVGNGTEVILNAGFGQCILRTDLPVSQGNFFLNLPSYDKLITPINGAYFLILTVVVFGGTWACYMFRKRRRQGGIPYQELEMAAPESASGNNTETADGWDKSWDDDWDEENAVRSPASRLAGSISANGLTSRSANKDGWENNWDE